MEKSPIVSPERAHAPKSRHTARSAGQNTLRNIGLICGREYKNQLTQRSFMITTIIYLLAIIIGSFVPTVIQYIGAHSNSQTTIAVINNAGSIAGMSGTPLINSIETSLNGSGNQAPGQNSSTSHFAVQAATATDLNTLKSDVKNGKLNILLVLDRTANQDVHFTCYTTTSDLADSDATRVQTMAGQLSIQDRAGRQHLSSAQVNSLFAEPQFTLTNLQQQKADRSLADTIAGYVLAYVGAILIFMAIMLYGNNVAQGVAEEKGNRIIEILINVTTPFQLMVGKIVGIGAAGLTQMITLVAVGIGMQVIQVPIRAALLGKTAVSSNPAISGAAINMLLLLLLYFILGFALYSSLYAAAGALVKRQEEARNGGAPINMLFMIGYIVSVSIASIPGVPDAMWVRIMSYVPFWSPTMMLMRIGVGTVAWWEILLTVILMALTFPLCAWISARIYRLGILMYGQSFSPRQLLKMVRTR
ncbi:MAG TPA: ABC transporter permease [Ktedonosporobacter sp.]|nr:ABC transporter permease [Ktedonosporobacter sp.]